MKLKGDMYYLSQLITNSDTQEQDYRDTTEQIHIPAGAQQGVFNPAASAQYERLNF